MIKKVGLEIDTEAELIHLWTIAITEEFHGAVPAIDGDIARCMHHQQTVNGNRTLVDRTSLNFIVLVLVGKLTGYMSTGIEIYDST